MSAIKLNSSGGGSITISPASTASTLTLTAPAQTGTIGLDGPAFNAYRSTNQSVSNNVITKIQFDAEEFDTASCYDTSTNRFTPNVAGYYFVDARAYFTASSTRPSEVDIFIYKNGVSVAMSFLNLATANQITMSLNVAKIIYMNGSTDYLEAYGFFSGSTSPLFVGGTQYTYFNAALVRAA